MRLYLSSYGLGNQKDKLVGLVRSNIRVAVIANAQDSKQNEARTERLQKEFVELNSLGFEPFEINLRDFFSKKNRKVDLKDCGLIWVCGGNVFNLRRSFKQSGFDDLLINLLKNDIVAYGGYSAGVCVLAPSLRGVELRDPTDDIPEGYNKNTIWEGLSILPYAVAPHYKSDHPESSSIDDVVNYFEKHKINFKTMRDGDIIIVDGQKEGFLN